jgi:hypothetical protein
LSGLEADRSTERVQIENRAADQLAHWRVERLPGLT